MNIITLSYRPGYRSRHQHLTVSLSPFRISLRALSLYQEISLNTLVMCRLQDDFPSFLCCGKSLAMQDPRHHADSGNPCRFFAFAILIAWRVLNTACIFNSISYFSALSVVNPSVLPWKDLSGSAPDCFEVKRFEGVCSYTVYFLHLFPKSI